MHAERYSLDYILNPGSVAIIGASASEGKWGHSILKGLIDGGYRGAIYPVNPRASSILGLKAYPSIFDIDAVPDFAVIGIKADLVPQAVMDCNKKGVKGIMIVSGGFGEAGEEGKKLQTAVLSAAGKMRVVGPNTLGIVNTSIDLNVSYLRPLKGPFALICQGGNVLNEIEYLAHKKGLGFTFITDPSNQADVSICDFLEYINDDMNTKAILIYMEGFKTGEGSRFLEMARKVTPSKPIIAIKSGITLEGARAAQSHTSSLAGSDAVYEAAFKQAGIIRAKNSSELVDIAETLVKLPCARGNKVAFLVDGGSHATMACDASSTYGLKLAELSPATQQTLKSVLMPFSSVSNPVDFAGAMDADVRVLSRASDILLQDKQVDALFIVGINFGGYSRWFGVEDLEVQASKKLASILQQHDKPIIFHNSVLSEDAQALKIIRDSGIPVFTDVERAARCLAALVNYSSHLKQERSYK